MPSSKKKTKAKAPARATKPTKPTKPAKAAKAAKPAPKAKAAKPAPKAKAAEPKPHEKPKAPAKGVAPTKGAAPAHPPAPTAVVPASKPKSGGKKSHRKSGLTQRRGPNGELLAVGEILLPGGPLGGEEIQYLFRGCVAAEHPAGDAGVASILAKLPASIDTEAARTELTKQMNVMAQRFGGGSVEPMLPTRTQGPRRTFQTVVDRAKLRRREIGAFLRGLDIGRTETSHMDSHGEASLQTLMEWAARLENLAEANEPDQADYAQFHRGLDQLENTTEALIVDVEATLRRLRDKVRSH